MEILNSIRFNFLEIQVSNLKKIIFAIFLIVSVNVCAQLNSSNANNTDGITKDPLYVGKSHKEVMDAEDGNVIFRGLNCSPHSSFVYQAKEEYLYQSCYQQFGDKFKYFVFKNGIYENTIDKREFDSKYLLNERQIEARIIEEERRAERLAEKEKQARILELKNRPYSKVPANFTVRIEGAKAVIITSTDNEPFLLERVVINNRIGVNGCDNGPYVEFMSMGDARKIPARGNCGDVIIKVDVFTNRGHSIYTSK